MTTDTTGPAFPCKTEEVYTRPKDDPIAPYNSVKVDAHHSGMTLRQYAAIKIMAGALAESESAKCFAENHQLAIKNVCILTDALLAELAK